MNRLFLYSQYVDASQNSTGFYFSGLIRGLTERFYGLTVIRNSEVGDRGYFSSTSAKNVLLFRISEQIFISLKLLIRVVLSLSRGDVFITGTNPTFLLIWMPLVKRIIGFRWVLVVHDVFPNNLIPAGILRADGVFYKLLEKYFAFSYSSANKLIVIGRDMGELIESKTGHKTSVVYIPNWACDAEVFPIEKTHAKFISDLGWENKIVFQFFGNIGRLQGLDIILDAIALTKNKEHAFLFIGGGAMVGKVKKFIDDNPEVNIAYVGPLALEEKNEGLGACDVAIVSLEAGMAGLGVPSKAYFSMAADKPILAIMEKNAEIARVVREHGIGWHIEPTGPEALASVFDRMTKDEIDKLRGRPRSVLQSFYSEHLAIESYCRCVSGVLS